MTTTPSATDLLAMLTSVDEVDVALMAHSLGWPDLYQIQVRMGRLRRGVRWMTPYRNRYYSEEHFLERWDFMVVRGWAESVTPPSIFRVTPLGMALTRLRLRAEIEHCKLKTRREGES